MQLDLTHPNISVKVFFLPNLSVSWRMQDRRGISWHGEGVSASTPGSVAEISQRIL